jgi:hypothetical protein
LHLWIIQGFDSNGENGSLKVPRDSDSGTLRRIQFEVVALITGAPSSFRDWRIEMKRIPLRLELYAELFCCSLKIHGSIGTTLNGIARGTNGPFRVPGPAFLKMLDFRETVSV